MRRNNAKEHVKLYKSKKNWVAATIFTTALGITGVSAVNNVSANSVSSSSSSVNSASSSQVSSSSVKPSSTVTLRSSSAANSSSTTVKSSSAQSSSVAAQKSSLQNQISQKKQDLSSEQSQQSNLQNQYQKDSQAAQQASQNTNQNTSKQAAQSTIDNLTKKGLQSQLSSVDNQISNYQKEYRNADSQLNSLSSQIDSVDSEIKNKTNELNQLQNDSYNDNEGVVENVAHMDHNSTDYKLMFGPMYTTNGDNNNLDNSDPLLQLDNQAFSPALSQHDLINSNHQLTPEQTKETCEALMAAINATRKAHGQQPFVMTDQMYNAVMERASQPSASYEHNMNDIYTALEDNGISSKDYRAENLAYADEHDPSVADLIRNSQESIFEMLNDDAGSNWGHRHNFLQDYGQPVQASFGLHWNGTNYNLAFDVANYNGNGSDNLLNQVSDWQNQTDANAVKNLSQIEALRNDISNLKKQYTDLQFKYPDLKSKADSLSDKCTDLWNEADNLNAQIQDPKTYGTNLFDENQLSPSDKKAYDDAQDILNGKQPANNSQLHDDLVKKANDDKAALDKLNNQIAQTKQEINDLENQLNALNNQPVASKPTTTTPSVNTPVANKPATTKPSVNTPVASKPATTPSVNNGKKTDDVLPGPDQIVVTPTETKVSNKTAANLDYNHGIDPLTGKALKDETPAQQQKAKAYVDALNKDTNNATASSKQNTPAKNTESPVVSTTVKTTSSVSNGKKTDDVLPGPDQIVVTPEKSSSSVAKKVVASISYNKGIDPLTNQLLSDETPAQRQKAKSYVENLNKTVAVKENKIAKPVYNQPITFTFSENKVKADNVKGGSEVKNELPTTGENQDKAATVLGIEAVSMGLALGGLSFLKRKKNN